MFEGLPRWENSQNLIRLDRYQVCQEHKNYLHRKPHALKVNRQLFHQQFSALPQPN